MNFKKLDVILLIIALGMVLQACKTSNIAKIKSKKNTDPVEVVAKLPSSVDQSFTSFFEKFTEDSLFQVNHTVFPFHMETYEAGEEDSTIEFIEKKDWTLFNFKYDPAYATRQLNAYTQSIKQESEVRVIIQVRGVDNGLYTDFIFVKKKGKWKMHSMQDMST